VRLAELFYKMTIIIDAYNLLYAVSHQKKKLSDHERNRFIKELSAYARRKGHTIVLVFDGGDYDHPVKEKKGNVDVIYSGINQSADEYIKRYLTHNKSAASAVVSSDREINEFAQSLSVMSIDVRPFFALVKEALQASVSKSTPNSAVKTTSTDDQDVDAYMQSIKNIPQKKEDFVRKNDTASKTANKHDRALLKKLSKL
jgi:predicted RNA-binding protein with PIN domain